MAGAPPFFQDYSFIVYVFYVFVKRANKPPSDLYGLAGRLIFCVSRANILRSGASRSVLLRSGAGAVCGLRPRGRCRLDPAGSRWRCRRACRWQAMQTYIHLLLLRCKILVGDTQTIELHPMDADLASPNEKVYGSNTLSAIGKQLFPVKKENSDD